MIIAPPKHPLIMMSIDLYAKLHPPRILSHRPDFINRQNIVPKLHFKPRINCKLIYLQGIFDNYFLHKILSPHLTG